MSQKLHDGFFKKGNKNMCVYKNCKNKAIDSHVIQKSLMLETIAEKGMVYCLSPKSIQNSLTKYENKPYDIINCEQATIFQGFCKDHDTSLFKTIELSNKLAKTSYGDYAFLYSYRGLAYDCWTRNILTSKHINPSIQNNFKNIAKTDNTYPLDKINNLATSIMNIENILQELIQLKHEYEKYINPDGSLADYKKEFLIGIVHLHNSPKFAGVGSNIATGSSNGSVLKATISMGVLPAHSEMDPIFYLIAQKKDKKLFDYFKNLVNKKQYGQIEKLYPKIVENIAFNPSFFKERRLQTGFNSLPIFN